MPFRVDITEQAQRDIDDLARYCPNYAVGRGLRPDLVQYSLACVVPPYHFSSHLCHSDTAIP